MQYTEENNIPGLLLSVDFEKAFDSVSWSFIYKVMEFFGFGKSIISWIKTFNNNVKLSVNQCGNLSSFFSIGRGCRQGDPVSTFLFILCAEILGLMIRNNMNISGIIINDKEHKLSQYADDTLFLLDGTSKSLNATLNVLYEYSQFSGLKVNFEKTHAVWIGVNKYSTASIKTRWKLSWGKTAFKLLGINFHIELQQMQQINFKEKIQKIRSLIKLWNRRYLTPLGKITVIKTLLLPILNHLFISIPNPADQTIKELNNIFFDFLWNGPAKIKQNVVIKQYCEGGLGMINLKAFIDSMKLTWLRRVILSNSPWQSVMNNTINFNELLVFGRCYTNAIQNKIKNKFWIDVLHAYSDILQLTGENTEHFVLSSPIFYNNKIMIGNQPIYIKKWDQQGIKNINDLLHENGEFLSQDEFEHTYDIKTNFVQFLGLKQAIMAYARTYNIISFSKKLHTPLLPASIHLLIKSKKGGKDFYTILNQNSVKPTSQYKWNHIYNIEEKTWKEIYSLPYNLSLGTKMQWFQTRINHRILPTKKYLYNMKYVPSPRCSFCQEEETINHMLWQCQETQNLIGDFKRWLNNNNINLTFAEELFIINLGKTYSSAELHIFVIIKYYIYAAKRTNHPLSIVALQNKLKYFYKLMQYTATRKGSLDKFENTWTNYKD